MFCLRSELSTSSPTLNQINYSAAIYIYPIEGEGNGAGKRFIEAHASFGIEMSSSSGYNPNRTVSPTPGRRPSSGDASPESTPLLTKLQRQYIHTNPLANTYVGKEIGRGVNETIKLDNSVRLRMREVLESMAMQRFIVLVIVFNAITLGLETSPAMVERFGRSFFSGVNNAVLLIFMLEIGIRVFVERVGFFADAWNWFDSFILIVTLVPQTGLYNQYAVFRVLRVVRLLRVIKVSNKLRLLTETLLSSLPTLAWFFVLLLVIFYIFALIGTSLFGNQYQAWFGTGTLTSPIRFSLIGLNQLTLTPLQCQGPCTRYSRS